MECEGEVCMRERERERVSTYRCLMFGILWCSMCLCYNIAPESSIAACFQKAPVSYEWHCLGLYDVPIICRESVCDHSVTLCSLCVCVCVCVFCYRNCVKHNLPLNSALYLKLVSYSRCTGLLHNIYTTLECLSIHLCVDV